LVTRTSWYWLTTSVVLAGFTMGGIVDLLRLPEAVRVMEHLGYPLYFMSIIGAWKLLAIAALLVPGRGLLKEWAYAGLFFDVTGAVISHAAVGDGVDMLLPPIAMSLLLVCSWWLRPASRHVEAT
jgi:hypothetical protein